MRRKGERDHGRDKRERERERQRERERGLSMLRNKANKMTKMTYTSVSQSEKPYHSVELRSGLDPRLFFQEQNIMRQVPHSMNNRIKYMICFQTIKLSY